MKYKRTGRENFLVRNIIFVLPFLMVLAYAQEIQWKRGASATPALALFHSTHVVNLPTAETMQQGDFEFEISHRFIPLLKEGYDAFWGLDGPANIRLAFGYAPWDHMVITLGRSNVSNNVDLQIKYKAFQFRHDWVPTIISLNIVAAWNKESHSTGDARPGSTQYFAQLIFNTLISGKLGIGVVPSYLYNSALTADETKYSFTLGNYLQYYFSARWSLYFEWNPTVTGWRDNYESVSGWIELETGGHFFKVFVTNNALINISQFLAGADKKFSDGDLHLGFMITRLL